MALKKSREFIPDITSKVGQKMLNDQLDWLWAQLLGNLPVKALSTELKGIIEAKAEATTLEDLADALDELTAVSDGALTIWYSATDPAGKAQYDIWFRITPQPYLIQRWIGGVWVDISSTATARALVLAYDAQQTADGKIKVYRQNDAPTGLTATDDGDLWFDTNDSNKLYAWNGSTLAWVSAQDTHLDDTVNAMKTEIIQAANELRLRAGLTVTDDFGTALETVMSEVVITAENITAEVTNKSAYVGASPPALADLYIGKLWVKTDTDEHLWWKDIVTSPLRSYDVTGLSGASVVFSDLSDKTELDVTVKTVAAQAGSGTPSPENVRAISGKGSVKAVAGERNLLKPKTTETKAGVTYTVAADGTITLNGTCTGAAGSPTLFLAPLGFSLDGQFTLSMNNAVAYGSDLGLRLMETVGEMVSGTDIRADWLNSRITVTLSNKYVYGWVIRVEGGKTYNNFVIKPQLEPGLAQKGYSPYDGKEHTLTPDSTLYGLTGAEDEIGNDGHVTHKTALVTLVGSESWTWGTSQPTTATLARFSLTKSDMAVVAAGICSHFPWDVTVGKEAEYATAHPSTAQLNIFINKARMAGWSDAWTNTQKVNAFKAWLAAQNTATTPVRVVYRLATAGTATVAPVEINGVDGTNTVTSDGASVSVDYLGSGWGLVSKESRRVYASSKFVIDENGATVRHVLLDGITPYEAWSHLYGGGLEIFETSTGDFIGGLCVRNGKVVLSASALADPRVSSDFLCLVFTETGSASGVATTKFGLKLGNGSAEALSFSVSAPDSNPSDVTGHISSRGKLMRLSTYTLDPGAGYGEIMLSPAGLARIIAKKTVSGTPYYAGMYFNAGSAIVECTGHLNPVDDGISNLGSSSIPTRWRRLYCTMTVDVSSDARLKQDISDLNPELIYKLRPRQYRLKASPEKLHFGFVAQEVKDALDECGIMDADLYGDENPESLSIRYGELHALETAAIHRLQRRIEDLERKLDILMRRHWPA